MSDVERRAFLQRTIDELEALERLAIAANETALVLLLIAARDEAAVRLAVLPPDVWTS